MTHGQKLNPDQATPLYFEAINLDYVAYLANVGRLDFDYLSTDLKCAIYSADFAIKELMKQHVAFDRSFSDLDTFGRRVDVLCRPSIVMQRNSP